MSQEPKIEFDAEPDPLETKVRFVCGVVFGLLMGGVYGLKFEIESLDLFLAFVGAVSVAFGLLAVRYGDQFWYSTFRLFRWF